MGVLGPAIEHLITEVVIGYTALRRRQNDPSGILKTIRSADRLEATKQDQWALPLQMTVKEVVEPIESANGELIVRASEFRPEWRKHYGWNENDILAFVPAEGGTVEPTVMDQGARAEVERIETAGRARDRVIDWLDTFTVPLPRRVVNEVLGDFIEDMTRRADAGQRALKIYLVAAAAAFWLIIHTVGYWRTLLGAKKSA